MDPFVPEAEPRSPNIFDVTPVGELSDGQLRERVVGYAGQMAALTARFMGLLVEFDNRHAWSGEGVMSCAHWLSWRTGLSLRTAQDHLRIAHALTELPLISQSFADGRVTYSKVRALTRVATPEREQELLNVALSATAAQVDALVRSMRHIDRGAEEQESGVIVSSGRWRWNDDGSLSVNLRLNPLDGARFLAGAVRAEYERTRTEDDRDVPRNALERDETATADAEDLGPAEVKRRQRDLWRHVPADIAPAMIAMADTLHGVVDIPEIAPGAEILVHTRGQDIADGDGDHADDHLDDGPALFDVEVDEARCGAAVREVHTTRRGAVLNWGHKRRTPTAALIRIVTQRDRCCRHPACGRTRHLHVHHVRSWADGGPTEPDNLILLCGTHHRALHRGEFTITAKGGQQFTFHRQSGSVIERAPTLVAPAGWTPDSRIAVGATMPVGGGRLDVGYTTEVLYAIGALKAIERTTPIAA
ncbi:DUF222 domain-containing protein [Gordonia hankookensis]|uniref:DUF222 domain-containing protein n=1 Tax=Gordonia hankookensis TaxID=589403 RepID=A0ABR7WJ08_9ACTN|nr:DUF222 domain-containing protein [Gordonia hankookensis]